MAGRADIRNLSLRPIPKPLAPAPISPPLHASPLFNFTKNVAKVFIVGAVLAYALWPARSFITHLLGGGAPVAEIALTKN